MGEEKGWPADAIRAFDLGTEGQVKPSDRIEQLSREIAVEHLGDAPLGELHNYKNLCVEAIMRYLNEVHEATQAKGWDEDHRGLLAELNEAKSGLQSSQREIYECHQWLTEYGVGGKGENLLHRISLMADMAHEKLESEKSLTNSHPPQRTLHRSGPIHR